MSYKVRDLTFEFTLQDGQSFDDYGNNILTIKKARSEVQLNMAGGETGTLADIRLYGISMQEMSKLAARGMRADPTANNRFAVRISCEGIEIFRGISLWSYIDANGAPDIALSIYASADQPLRSMAISDTNISGNVSLVDALQAVASQANISVINYGVSIVLPGVSVKGSIKDQILDILHSVKPIDSLSYDIGMDYVSIFPKGYADKTSKILVSKDTGLKGYPSFIDFGVSLRTSFNPNFKINAVIELESELPNISGTWQIVNGCTHYLNTNIDSGAWDSFITCVALDN